MPLPVKTMIADLEAQGYVVLRAKSYRQAQERQRVAEALLRAEVEHAEGTRRWAHQAFESQREAWDRTTYLYGLAASLGATDEQLHRTKIDRNKASEIDTSLAPDFGDHVDVSGRQLQDGDPS